VGCIPSKALLHAAKVIEDAEEMGARGIAFGAPQLDLQRLRAWKSSVVAKLTGGLKVLVKQRKVDVVRGTGRFVGPNVLEVMGTSGSQRIHFDQCIIAAGSEPVRLAGLPDDPRILDSTDALELPSFSGGLLVVGGGIIGLEMACVFDALRVRVSVVELTPQLMPGCDPDLVRPLERRIRSRYGQILLGTRVEGIDGAPGGMHVGKVASEVAAGHKRAFDVRTIPSVAYTDPEIAWLGLTETDARANGTAFRKGAFPWVANGRSLSLGRDEGFTKLLFDPDNHRV